LNISFQEQTIVAQCTPIGSGALAIIRLSGKDSFFIAEFFSRLASKKKISEVGSHTVHFGRIIRPLEDHLSKDEKVSDTIDQVMFVVMRAPKTFTGEDVLEITCHNNQFIVEEIINLSIRYGARLAQNGEFAKRAFLNNKIDLTQAESINELIHSSNQQALKKSLSQLEGSFSSWIVEIEKELLNCLVLSEASFEFLDDDDIEFRDKIYSKINLVLKKIKKLKLFNNDYSSIREGLRIAILGSVNAGKSSLFNYLIKKDRAIVTDIEGTTRDTIESGVYKKDSFVTFVDTAGIRKTKDIVEKEGIKRSLFEAHKADIILLVVDISKELSSSELQFYNDLMSRFKSKILWVNNKIDLSVISENLVNSGVSDVLNVSINSGTGLLKLEQALDQRIEQILKNYEVPFILNKRQYSLMIDLENKLNLIKDLFVTTNELSEVCENQVAYEILSIHLKEALESISHLSGKNISEAAMDAVFKEFCVGK
jgi:tRNA modification GTPase